MKKILTIIIFSLFLLGVPWLQAQEKGSVTYYPAQIIDGDTVICLQLPTVHVYPPLKFKNKKAEDFYWKNVRDVRKTLPYAKLVYNALIETYEYIQTLPDDKARQAHLKKMEKELFEQYKPILKTLTYSQAKILIRLIDRECNQSSFQLIKAFLGGFRAGFWQTFGSLFGVSLKAEWDPNGKDAQLERICSLIESGQL